MYHWVYVKLSVTFSDHNDGDCNGTIDIWFWWTPKADVKFHWLSLLYEVGNKHSLIVQKKTLRLNVCYVTWSPWHCWGQGENATCKARCHWDAHSITYKKQQNKSILTNNNLFSFLLDNSCHEGRLELFIVTEDIFWEKENQRGRGYPVSRVCWE